jgi:uncharacterized protein YkwD
MRQLISAFLLLFLSGSVCASAPLIPDPDPLPEVEPVSEESVDAKDLIRTVKNCEGEERVQAAVQLLSIGGEAATDLKSETQRLVKLELKNLRKVADRSLEAIEKELRREHGSDHRRRVQKAKSRLGRIKRGDKEAAKEAKEFIEPVIDSFYHDPDRLASDEAFVAAASEIKRLNQIYQKAGGTKDLNVDAMIRQVIDDAEFKVFEQRVGKKNAMIFKQNEAKADQLDEEENKCVRITNIYRVLMGEDALPINVTLCEAARDHSKDMKEKNFFAHDSPVPGKKTPRDRAAKFGTFCMAENIARTGTSGHGAFWAWFLSPGHHKNMINKWGQIGVGRVDEFWTENF